LSCTAHSATHWLSSPAMIFKCLMLKRSSKDQISWSACKSRSWFRVFHGLLAARAGPKGGLNIGEKSVNVTREEYNLHPGCICGRHSKCHFLGG
jgi:hypothetical protein